MVLQEKNLVSQGSWLSEKKKKLSISNFQLPRKGQRARSITSWKQWTAFVGPRKNIESEERGELKDFCQNLFFVLSLPLFIHPNASRLCFTNFC